MSSANDGLYSFKPVTDLDDNAWYQISEERVDKYKNDDWSSSLQVADRDTGRIVVTSKNPHVWQFQKIDAKRGRYSLRCIDTGIFKQLSVCYNEEEIAEGHTQPCLAPSHGGDEQIWEITDWGFEGNSTLRFTNVKNGTKYWMDVHRGNPMFMSPDIDTAVYHPAQRWLIKSVSAVNDGDFSRTFTDIPTSTSSTATITTPPTTTTTDSNDPGNTGTSGDSQTEKSGSGDGGVPVGVAAGVGVGVGVAVIALALGLFFWWRRRQHRKNAGAAAMGPTSPETGPAGTAGHSDYKPVPMDQQQGWAGQQQQQQQQGGYPQGGYYQGGEYYKDPTANPHELGDTPAYQYELPARDTRQELGN